MRFVMHVAFPPDKFNQAARDGTVGRTIGRILEETKPEAVYFCAKDGKRGCILIIDMKETSEMARFAEPWFLGFDADVEFLPTMTPEDLQKAGVESIAKKWK
jgi:hypothetical protein